MEARLQENFDYATSLKRYTKHTSNPESDSNEKSSPKTAFSIWYECS